MASKTATTTATTRSAAGWRSTTDSRPSCAGPAAATTAVLPIDFPGGAGEDELEHVSWEKWFAKFDENDLAFLHQQEKADGEDSTFFKLVARDR